MHGYSKSPEVTKSVASASQFHGAGLACGPPNSTRVHTIGSQPRRLVGALAGVSTLVNLTATTGVVRDGVSSSCTGQPPCLAEGTQVATKPHRVSMENLTPRRKGIKNMP